MLTRGMEAHATQYARLLLDIYIKLNRESDNTAVKLTKRQPSIFYLGHAEMAPDRRPIGMVMVDEYNTSQT